MKLFTNCWAKLTLGKTYFAVVFIFLFGAVAIEITLIAESLPDAIKTPAEAHQQAEPTTNTLESPASQNRKDDPKPFEQCLKDAEAGIPEAQYELGEKYYGGFCGQITINYEKAAEWYQKAAASGHTEAQYSLGLMYQYGRGVTQDNTKAFEFYQKAAESEYRPAKFKLGCMYKHGAGVEKDEAKAAAWFRDFDRTPYR